MTLRLTAKSESETEAWIKIDELQTEILNRVGKFVYGFNNDSLASKLREILIDNNLTISAAESMTAGLFQSELAAVPGMGEALVGGMITYTEDIKVQQLGVDRKLFQNLALFRMNVQKKWLFVLKKSLERISVLELLEQLDRIDMVDSRQVLFGSVLHLVN